MTDRHLRLLAAQARRDQRRLDEDVSRDAAEDLIPTEQRRELRARATRTRARLAAARARRLTGGLS